MATYSFILSSSVQGMSGGANASTGFGFTYLFNVSGTYVIGDLVTLIFTDNVTGVQTQVGAGNVTGLSPVFTYTFNNKVYILNQNTVFFSAIGDPETFNDPNGLGNGFVVMSNQIPVPQPLTAIQPYQGRLAFFTSQSVQLWLVDADPAQWQLSQTLTNIGAIAPATVQALGDADVFFLHTTGVRSLRVRNSSNNAYVADVGSPIDNILQPVIVANPTTAPLACSVVEPTSNRYLTFLVDTFYTLSYFPTSKVVAWSTYTPQCELQFVNGTPDFIAWKARAAFTPQKFVVLNGQVWARDVNYFYLLGGVGNQQYDTIPALVVSPYMDASRPSTLKNANGIDMVGIGGWLIDVGQDPQSDILTKNVWQGTEKFETTYDLGTIPMSENGTHFKFQATSNEPVTPAPGVHYDFTTPITGRKVLSMFVFKYAEEGEL